MHEFAAVKPSDSLLEAANIVVNRKMHRLVVVDDSGKLVGLLSRGEEVPFLCELFVGPWLCCLPTCRLLVCTSNTFLSPNRRYHARDHSEL
jgi:CBS domain